MLRGRVTMILVTHRPERLAAADQLLRLESGGLKELAVATEGDRDSFLS